MVVEAMVLAIARARETNAVAALPRPPTSDNVLHRLVPPAKPNLDRVAESTSSRSLTESMTYPLVVSASVRWTSASRLRVSMVLWTSAPETRATSGERRSRS